MVGFIQFCGLLKQRLSSVEWPELILTRMDSVHVRV